jgi:hypothetical protein
MTWFEDLTTLSQIEGRSMPWAKLKGTPRLRNKKPEARNSKQIQMIKNQKVPNKPVSNFDVGISAFRFDWVRGASFDIRISEFDTAEFGVWPR